MKALVNAMKNPDPVAVEKAKAKRLWASAVKRVEKQIKKIQLDEDATKAIRAFERAEEKAWSILGREGADERYETAKRLRAAAIKAREEASKRRIEGHEKEARRLGQEMREQRKKEWWRNPYDDGFRKGVLTWGDAKPRANPETEYDKGFHDGVEYGMKHSGLTKFFTRRKLLQKIKRGRAEEIKKTVQEMEERKRKAGAALKNPAAASGKKLTQQQIRILKDLEPDKKRGVRYEHPPIADLLRRKLVKRTKISLEHPEFVSKGRKPDTLTAITLTKKGRDVLAERKKNPASQVQSRPDRNAPIALRQNRALWEKVHGSARRIYNGDLAKFARLAADKVVADAPRMKSWGKKARMPNPGTTVFLGQLIELHVLGSDGNIVMYVPKKPPPLLWSPGVRRDQSDGSLFAFAGMRVPNPEASCRASEAAELYKAWNAGEKEPRGMSRARVSRPEMPGAVPAIAVVYRSDKFTPNPVEYIHHFEEGVRARTDGKVFYVTGGHLTLTERGLEK